MCILLVAATAVSDDYADDAYVVDNDDGHSSDKMLTILNMAMMKFLIVLFTILMI